MADLVDISVDQTVIVVATVTAIDPDDRHFQEVTLKLSYPETGSLSGQVIKLSNLQVTVPEEG